MQFHLLRKIFLGVLFVSPIIEAARPLCSAESCASIKRDLKSRIQRDVINFESPVLNSRSVESVGDDEDSIATFIKNRVDKLPAANKIYNDQNKNSPSTSIFFPFEDNSFDIGLKYLTGCTALVIVSNTGVYAAHFFEDKAMDPQRRNLYASALLRAGGNKSFIKLSDRMGDLNSSPYPDKNFPEVFIITPQKSGEPPGDDDSKAPLDTRPAKEMGFEPDKREYEQAYQDILAVIRENWPEIDSVKEVRYEALNKHSPSDMARLKDRGDGKILFEYNKTPSAKGEVRLWLDSAKKFQLTLK